MAAASGAVGQTDALAAAFERLRALNAEAVRISRAEDPKWRHELVALRRHLSAAVAEVSGLIDRQRALAPTPELIEFASRFGAMRRSLAIHQAAWPVVLLDINAPEYTASVDQIRTSFEALTQQGRMLFSSRN